MALSETAGETAGGPRSMPQRTKNPVAAEGGPVLVSQARVSLQAAADSELPIPPVMNTFPNVSLISRRTGSVSSAPPEEMAISEDVSKRPGASARRRRWAWPKVSRAPGSAWAGSRPARRRG